MLELPHLTIIVEMSDNEIFSVFHQIRRQRRYRLCCVDHRDMEFCPFFCEFIVYVGIDLLIRFWKQIMSLFKVENDKPAAELVLIEEPHLRCKKRLRDSVSKGFSYTLVSHRQVYKYGFPRLSSVNNFRENIRAMNRVVRTKPGELPSPSPNGTRQNF